MKKLILVLIFVAFMFIGYLYVSNNVNTQIDNKVEQENLLSQIDNYQTQYWEIIKRHNMYIQIAEIDEDIKKDQSDLKNLYVSIEDKISKDNKYLRELNRIKNKYNLDLEKAQTQTEMNILAGEYLDDTDKILNEVYQEIKKIDKQDDFEALKSSEIKWIEMLKDCQKFIDSQGFGSILGLVYCKTTQNIKHFRALLLIFYLEHIS